MSLNTEQSFLNAEELSLNTEESLSNTEEPLSNTEEPLSDTEQSLAKKVALVKDTEVTIVAQRIVILTPSAVDIVEKLGLGNHVVGVTNSVDEFPAAKRVGTSINPSIEVVASLKPTVIISSSRFSQSNAKRINAVHYVYEPRSVDDLILSIFKLGEVLGVQERGQQLAYQQIRALDSLKGSVNSAADRATVLYEVRSNPLTVAGTNSIVADALNVAGFNVIMTHPSSTTVSVEYIMANQPDYYIFQDGPMNKNPIHPADRKGWKLKSCIWRFDEKRFARANTNIIKEIQKINYILNLDITDDEKCAEGIVRWSIE